MKKRKPVSLTILKKHNALRVGFLPLNDCAPLAVAHELGLFKEYDLPVELIRETSWKRIHDKIVQGEMDAVQAPATLPFLINLGLTSQKTPCVSGMVLSLQGNAITVSRNLWGSGVRDAATLREQIFRDVGKRTYTFGVAFPLSSQYFLLCEWLRSAKIASEVRIITAPPSQMFPLLKLGYLDGFCAGEPWSSVAAHAGVGMCVATSAMLAPLHPEKVLLVRKEFADKRADVHERLIAALLEACAWCDQPENRPQLCELLAQPEYVDAPVECLRAGLVGPLAPADAEIRPLHGLNIFHRYRANEPTAARAAWITGQLYRYFRWDKRPGGLDNIFRRDIFLRAQRLVAKHARATKQTSEGSAASINSTSERLSL